VSAKRSAQSLVVIGASVFVANAICSLAFYFRRPLIAKQIAIVTSNRRRSVAGEDSNFNTSSQCQTDAVAFSC
jgi:hypothetical protein